MRAKSLLRFVCEGVLNSFMWKTPSSPKNCLLSPNFSEPHVYLQRDMSAKTGKKTIDV